MIFIKVTGMLFYKILHIYKIYITYVWKIKTLNALLDFSNAFYIVNIDILHPFQ